VPSLVAFPIAFLIGTVVSGPGAGASAAIGVAVVYLNFSAHGTSLAWASTISISAVHGVALFGPVVRIGVIIGLMFGLNTMGWFSPLAFGLAVMPGTMLLLFFEARLTIRGLGSMLQIPADPAAMRAAEALTAREAS